MTSVTSKHILSRGIILIKMIQHTPGCNGTGELFCPKKNLTSEMVAQKSSWHIKDSHNQNYCKKYQHTIVMWESIALEANNDLNFFSRLCQHLWPVTWDWPSQTTPPCRLACTDMFTQKVKLMERAGLCIYISTLLLGVTWLNMDQKWAAIFLTLYQAGLELNSSCPWCHVKFLGPTILPTSSN